MTRASITTYEGITRHHGCIGSPRDIDAGLLLEIAPYQTIAIDVTSPSVHIPAIREMFELVEIYVPTHGGDDAIDYEPLEAKHFAVNSSWTVIARKRHPLNDVRIVGIMLAKDEADIIPDVISDMKQHLDALYYLADDEATGAAIAQFSPAGWARAVPWPDGRHTDGCRQYLLEQARRDAVTANDPRPMWVVSAQGDEIYHDDLRHFIRLAQSERATVLNAHVGTFVIHESQREGWNWSLPIEKRLTHYIWDFGEHSAFLAFPWAYYDVKEHMRAHPHGIYPNKYATSWPVRKHYPFRSPEQAKARIEDRLKSGWQPHYENYRAIFMNEKAAGREVKLFHGWFPEIDRPKDGIW